jgi:Rrf2 family nitric oxide-sensitive transcriptional repressor
MASDQKNGLRMRLTTYTDYTLRVLMYLSLKHRSGALATGPEIARAYGISRNHLTKIIHELGKRGVIRTVQGRGGGVALAHPPERISIGRIVRDAEADFALVECHVPGSETSCAVWPACHLKTAFRRAVAAFLQELDRVTLADAVSSRTSAARLLGIADSRLPPIVAAGTQSATAAKRRTPSNRRRVS